MRLVRAGQPEHVEHLLEVWCIEVNTDQLLRAERYGAELLHNGAAVSYEPRWPGDKKPWVHYWRDKGLRLHSERYKASQVQAVFEEGEG